MKHITLLVLLIGLFSCSSNMKTNESGRTVSSDEDYAKIVELFKQPRALFDLNAKSAKQNAMRTLSMLQKKSDIVECKKNSNSKNFFSSACTKALKVCEETKVNVFENVHMEFIDNISKVGLKAEAEVREKLNEGNKELQSLEDLMRKVNSKIGFGSNSIANNYFAEKKEYSINIGTKKNNLKLCESQLQAEIDAYEQLKASYDVLIPQ